VTRADGAERWARLLPFAFRNGDIDVEVSEEQLQRLRELTREDLAEGLRAAVSEKRSE